MAKHACAHAAESAILIGGLPVRGCAVSMLVLLFALSCLISAMRPPAHPGQSVQMSLLRDPLGAVFLELKFEDICQSFYVSKSFSCLVEQILEDYSCFIKHDGKRYLNYTQILRQIDAMGRDVANSSTAVSAYAVRAASPGFILFRSILEAEFGHCISHSRRDSFQFHLHSDCQSLLNDGRKISVLPYTIGKHVHEEEAAYIIRSLVKMKRFDLLDQIRFEGMSTLCFDQLMSAFPPTSVVANAVKALQATEPDSGLLKWLYHAGFGAPVDTLPEDPRPPLYILRYLHENAIPVPKDWVFVGGLEESSISFWMHVLNSEAAEAEKLLHLIMEHGDDQSKHLAGSFNGLVSALYLTCVQKDVYEAMLTRFRFSSICNEAATLVYEKMDGKFSARQNLISALIDCEQFHFTDQYGIKDHGCWLWELLINELYRLKDATNNGLVAEYVKYMGPSPAFLRRLIRQKAHHSYLEIVWSPIYSEIQPSLSDGSGCAAELEMLKSLAFGQDIPFDNAKMLLGALATGECFGVEVSDLERTLYTAVDWEASEKIIERLLAELPESSVLSQKYIVPLLQSNRYSNGFWKRLIGRCGRMESCMREALEQFRTELATELGLFS